MKTQNADQSPGHGLAQPKPSAKFVKAHDRLGHPILGLWQRGRRFYFQTQLSGERSCRKIPLKTEDNLPAADVNEAQAAIVAFRAQLARGRAVICRSPRFDEFAEHYKAHVTQLGIKTARTILNEKSTITGWKKFLGPTRLDQVSIQHILDYATQRRKDGLSSRTVNVDVIVLSSVLKLAVQEKKLARRVTDEWEPLPYQPPRRPLRTYAEIEKLCAEAIRKNEDGTNVYESGRALADYLRLMAFSGARRDSALAVQWDDIIWPQKQLWLRKTKFSKSNIFIDLNTDLEKHLGDMEARRLDSPFLFPSPANPDCALTTLTHTFVKVRAAAGLPDFHFHDLRHYFASQCIMAGIDFFTVGRWLGHNDHGVLLAKIYAHITNQHGQSAAAKVSLTGQGKI